MVFLPWVEGPLNMTRYNWQDLNWQDPNFLSAWGKKLTEIIADFLVIFIFSLQCNF